MLVATVIGGGLTLSAQGGSFSDMVHQIPAVAPGMILVFALFAILGVGVGSVLTNQVAAIIVCLGWFLILEGILVSSGPRRLQVGAHRRRHRRRQHHPGPGRRRLRPLQLVAGGPADAGLRSRLRRSSARSSWPAATSPEPPEPAAPVGWADGRPTPCRPPARPRRRGRPGAGGHGRAPGGRPGLAGRPGVQPGVLGRRRRPRPPGAGGHPLLGGERPQHRGLPQPGPDAAGHRVHLDRAARRRPPARRRTPAGCAAS